MEVRQNPLGSAPLGKLLVKFAVPSIISMLVSALYNIVDQIFIGQAEDTHHDNAECDCHNTDVDLAEESQQDHDDEQHQRDNVKCSFHK